MKREIVVIFDIDGTLASKEFPSYPLTKIPPIKNVLKIALAAQKSDKSRMAIVTARPEIYRKETEKWVRDQGLSPELLLMRANSDRRPDPDVRVDQVRKVMSALGKNAVLYDDKADNCRAVKGKVGIPVKHVSRSFG